MELWWQIKLTKILAKEQSWISEIDNFPQWVVMQTFSKSQNGCLRVGMALHNKKVELMKQSKTNLQHQYSQPKRRCIFYPSK